MTLKNVSVKMKVMLSLPKFASLRYRKLISIEMNMMKRTPFLPGS